MRRLLLGVNVVVLLVPVLAIVLLRIYDAHLVEQTERRLIAESVIIGEAWRSAWLAARGVDEARAPDIAPPGLGGASFFPIEPVVDVAARLTPPEPAVRRRPAPEPGTVPRAAPADPAAVAAGEAIQPLLQRAKRINLTGVRVLDADGCVVASTAPDRLEGCLVDHPEVQRALAGEYHAVARPRHSDEPTPPLTAISRGGTIRVFTATPIHSGGKVVGVVRMSRTTIEAARALWKHRSILGWGLVASLVLVLALSLFLSRRITRPVRAIRDAAQAIARGEPRQPLSPDGAIPAELFALSEALDAMTAELARRANYVADFAANVSHELKTPITAIRGASELLEDAWPGMDDAQRGRFLANIQADARRMERLVTDLLRLARLENAPAHAAEPARLAEILDGLGAHADPARLQIQVAAPLADLPLALPADELHGALGNLVDNALTHGGDGPVTVTAARDGAAVTVTVTDQGPGISANNRDKVFERFFTTRRDRGGTGLGLPIVRAIARARGGDAWLAHSGAEGTAFALRLPVAHDPAVSAPA
ncbi:MAG: HAMP domain-containing protein [Myxococcales bacterium]|nr:HAMP domain-containing protein [Myxococcales bacterium]